MLCNFKISCTKMPYIVEKNGVIVDINDKFLHLSGFKREELINKKLSFVWKNLLRISIQLDSVDNKAETILFTKSLEVLFVNLQKHKTNDTDKYIYIFSKNTELYLKDEFKFLNRLIYDNKMGIAIYTAPDLMLLKLNDAFINYIPKPYNSREFIYGKCIKEYRHDFKGSKIESLLLNVINTNESYYCTEKLGFVRGYENRYWDCNIIPISEGDKVKYIVFMLTDATERVLSRDHIQLKNKQLEAILESSDDLVEIFNKDGFLIMGTHSLGQIFNEVKTNNFNMLKNYDNTTSLNGEKIIPKDLTIKKILNGEVFNQKKLKVIKNGVTKYFEISGKPIYDENEEIIYAFIVSRDITEYTVNMNLIEKQNKKLQKAIIMKDEFISLVSHEFRTPLNVIYSAIQLIEQVYLKQLPDRVKSLINNIKQNTFRHLKLVNNLIDITKINSGQIKLNMQNIDIVLFTKEIIDSVNLYANQKNIILSFDSNMESKIINIDSKKYQRIILNLLSNAVKFTNSNGKIIVTLNENRSLDMIEIKVNDTGIGIPKDKQKIIFDIFGQVDNNLSRQAEGTGMGLFIVKSLVNMMDGTIELESKVDVGSIFIVNLPLKAPLEENEDDYCFDLNNKLLQSIDIEFSDIYL